MRRARRRLDKPIPRRLTACVILFSLASLLAAHPSHAQTQSAAKPASDRLVSISGTGSHRYSSQQIAAASGLHAGNMATKDDLQSGADALSVLGTFVNVQYRFTTVPAGIKVEFQVTDAPAVPVSFDNFPWFSDAELNEALKAAVGLYDGTAPETGAILDAMSAALVKQLAARGVQAAVSHALVTLPGGERHARQFRVEGPTLRVEGIEFTDKLAKSDRAIQDRASDLVGKPFSRSAVELFEYEQVRPV
jgi:outer membrane protein assembly factor BamA